MLGCIHTEYFREKYLRREAEILLITHKQTVLCYSYIDHCLRVLANWCTRFNKYYELIFVYQKRYNDDADWVSGADHKKLLSISFLNISFLLLEDNI